MREKGRNLIQTKEGTLINLRVVPSSREDRVDWNRDSDMVRVHVKAPSHEGKANERLIRILKNAFGGCEIISGRSSRNKVVLIKNATVDGILRKNKIWEDKQAFIG